MEKPHQPLPRSLRVALARTAYDTGNVRIVDRDLNGFAHLVATRHGLFAVNPQACKPIAYGLFFGLCVRGNSIYAFEACDDPRSKTPRGRIVRFHHDRGTIVSTDVIATGLANGCHQIDFIHGRLCVLDTYDQRIVSFDADGGDRRDIYPLGRIEGNDWDDGYVHFSSLIARGQDILVMFHNGGDKTGRRSEISTFDSEWTLRGRVEIDGFGCHNFALLENGSLLSCGSLAGELIATDGTKVKVCDLMTRGLSVDDTTIVVGGSALSARQLREEMAGEVMFLDRAYRQRAAVEVPGPPLDIRRIDGQDRSLSTFLAGAAFTGSAR